MIGNRSWAIVQQMSDRRQSKPHICLFPWMAPHEPMGTSGPGVSGCPYTISVGYNYRADKKKPQTLPKKPINRATKNQTKNPLVFSGCVRSATDLFVEAGEQEGGSALD